jgi:DNA-binding GntR family transcriptional regulator
MGHKGTTEHRNFVEAIAERDAEKATQIMATHLDRTARRVGRVRTARANAVN